MKPHALTLRVFLLLSSAAAWAHAGSEDHETRHHDGHDGHDGGSGAGRHHPKGPDEADETDETDDAGPPVAIHLTAAQSELRDKLVGQQRLFVRDMARAHGPHIAPAVRQAVGVHWRHVMRLLRIRELAEEENDASVVKHVDDLRDREDERFVALMQRMMDGGGPSNEGGLK